MPRWLFISLAIVAAQLVLAIVVGAILRRAASRARRPGWARVPTLVVPRPVSPRVRSAWRRVVGL